MSDEFVLPKQIREDYVVRRHADFAILCQSLENNSIDEFKRIGHQIAGNAESYGFSDLGLIGVKMEKLRLIDLKSEGPRLISDFRKWLDNVIVE